LTFFITAPTPAFQSAHFNHNTQELTMPFANFKFPEGIIDAARKEDIIHRTTAMFVEYFGEAVRPYTMVLVEEVADGGWGRADETLTLAKLGLPAAPR
jgi:4-oxalocrotonate tautomerase